MSKVSVVINTLNEEENLPRAISSVYRLADEIIVVDMKSDDDTPQVAKEAGAKVFEHERTGYVEPARNFAISKAKGKWILVLDADEELPPALVEKLMTIIKDKGSADYYRLPRKNIIFGKWIKHSRWWPDYNIRFFKKGHVNWNEVIHSVPMTKGRGLDLEVKEDFAIIHHHYQTIGQYIDRMNRYTTEHARLITKDGHKFNWEDLIKKPSGEFLSRYFQGEGYKDGVHGLALAGLQAASEFIMYLKVWEGEKFRKKKVKLAKAANLIKENQKDVNYWVANSLLNQEGGLVQKIKRRFKLP